MTAHMNLHDLERLASANDRIFVAVSVAAGKPGMMLDIFSNVQDRPTIKQVLVDALEAMDIEDEALAR